MAFVLADRVRETTTTTGTGTVTLAGAVLGFQTFTAIGNGNTTYYTIAGQGTTEWEVGIGTYTSSGTTLSRTTVLASSNAGSLVNFSAGTKDVFCDYPAGKAVNYDTVGVVALGSGSQLTGAVNPIVSMSKSTNGYVQSYVFNANTGISASADFTAYANNSTDAHGWADVGFTGSNYADTTYTVTGPNEAYLFGSALNSTYTGNLVYATDSTGSANAHQFYVGGFTQAKTAWKAQVDSTGLKATQVNATNGLIVNSMTVSANYTIATGDSAMSVGPITVASGVSVTVSSGSRWVVL